MRVVLLYPPPWKIPLPGQPLDPVDGPPDDVQPGDLDWDFFQTPYGLFSLGAQALRAGHEVKLFNLSGFAWEHARHVLESVEADLWGMSCWTANRRGVALVAKELKKLYPRTHVLVGGPHATPLAKEMLEHHAAIDTVALGESEETFLELLGRLEKGEPLSPLAGAWTRSEGALVEGPERRSIERLEELASPHDYYDTHIVMTSRGCPWQCTFCGAETTWGRGFRALSTARVVDALDKALSRLPVKMVMIKDDTFTTNRKRVLDLCRAIRAKGLNFVWSCDTRVDVLNEDLLREMRLAGCQRMSLGVESGSQKVLDAIDKKITVEEILASTALAKKYGITVRYYMMLGNRGETAETLRETERFLQVARPHQYHFSLLSVYPGTRDFYDAEAAGWLDRQEYFRGRFQEWHVTFDATESDAAAFNEWYRAHEGLQTLHVPTVEERRATLALLGDLHTAHLDLGAALFDAGELDEAETHVRRALELGHPLPGIVHNYLACIARARGDAEGMLRALDAGVAADPQHPTLLRNADAAAAWLAKGDKEPLSSLELSASNDFELLERALQPTLPGPLQGEWARWSAMPPLRPIEPLRPKHAALLDARRLRVVAP